MLIIFLCFSFHEIVRGCLYLHYIYLIYMMKDSCSRFILSIYCEGNYLSLSFNTFPLYISLLIKEVKVNVIMEVFVLMLSLALQVI